MLLAQIAAVSTQVAAEAARNEKIAILAGALAELSAEELPLGVSYLAGVLPQGSFGVGFAALRNLPPAATGSTVTLGEADAALEALAAIRGPGSTSHRTDEVVALFARLAADEQAFLTALLLGGLRQGASERLMMDAIAKAFNVPAGVVRRAAMFTGDVAEVAVVAREGGREGLEAIGLRLFRPVSPMLAKTASDVGAGIEKLGRVAVERKLDGARIQVHCGDGEVRVFTRNLNEVTDRVPEIVAAVAEFPVRSIVLDGEAIALHDDGRPFPFQITMARFGTAGEDRMVGLSAFFFDVLHVDGEDVLDLPTHRRLEIMENVVPAQHLIPRIFTSDPEEAAAFFDETLATGHEGVMVKSLDAPYEAGRRGAGWLKVKPVHTLDLVVLAVEWGSGRRHGWLSNIHLGARAADGSFVMLGKTFKGMTDKMLDWQTKRFLELETHRDGHVVYVRPEQVVEIAFDGIQASSRYSGGMALRFARVKGYRDDKSADEADTIETVRAVFEGAG